MPLFLALVNWWHAVSSYHLHSSAMMETQLKHVLYVISSEKLHPQPLTHSPDP